MPLERCDRTQQLASLVRLPDRWHVMNGEVGEKMRTGRADEGGVSELGRVDVGRAVEVGVDVAIGPVVQVDRRYGKLRILVDIVIAAHGEGRVIGTQRLLTALRRNQRIL